MVRGSSFYVMGNGPKEDCDFDPFMFQARQTIWRAQMAPEGGSHLKAENIGLSFRGRARLKNNSKVTGAHVYFQTESS